MANLKVAWMVEMVDDLRVGFKRGPLVFAVVTDSEIGREFDLGVAPEVRIVVIARQDVVFMRHWQAPTSAEA